MQTPSGLLYFSPTVGKGIHPSVCLSVCLSQAAGSTTAHQRYDYYSTPIGSPMLEVEPTGQRGHWTTGSGRSGNKAVAAVSASQTALHWAPASKTQSRSLSWRKKSESLHRNSVWANPETALCLNQTGPIGITESAVRRLQHQTKINIRFPTQSTPVIRVRPYFVTTLITIRFRSPIPGQSNEIMKQRTYLCTHWSSNQSRCWMCSTPARRTCQPCWHCTSYSEHRTLQHTHNLTRASLETQVVPMTLASADATAAVALAAAAAAAASLRSPCFTRPSHSASSGKAG